MLRIGRNMDGTDWVLEMNSVKRHTACVGEEVRPRSEFLLTLLEEAADSNIPAVTFDITGYLANQLFLFPDPEKSVGGLRKSESEESPVGEGSFREQVRTWRENLTAFGKTGEDVARIRQAVDRLIVTPGARVGSTLDLLSTLRPPAMEDYREHQESYRGYIREWISAYLTLLGCEPHPDFLEIREFLTAVTDHAFRTGRLVDPGFFVQALETPKSLPAESRAGDFPLPPEGVEEVLEKMNIFLSSDMYSTWTTGLPLEMETFFFSHGTPRHTLVYLAHLKREEQIFWVSLLLNRLHLWLARRPFSESVQFVTVMDHVPLLFPVTAGSGSVRSFSRILRQIRHGLGIFAGGTDAGDFHADFREGFGTWIMLDADSDRAKPGRRARVHSDPEQESSGHVVARMPLAWVSGSLTLSGIAHLKMKRTTGELIRDRHIYHTRPRLSVSTPERFVAARSGDLLEPFLVADVRVFYKVSEEGRFQRFVVFAASLHGESSWRPVSPPSLFPEPPEGVIYRFSPLEEIEQRVEEARSELLETVRKTCGLKLFYSEFLDLYSRPGEEKEEFMVRLRESVEPPLLKEKKQVRIRYERELERLTEGIEKQRKPSESVKEAETFQDLLSGLSKLKFAITKMTQSPWAATGEHGKEVYESAIAKKMLNSRGEMGESARAVRDLFREIRSLEESYRERLSPVKTVISAVAPGDIEIQDLYIAWMGKDDVKSAQGEA